MNQQNVRIEIESYQVQVVIPCYVDFFGVYNI